MDISRYIPFMNKRVAPQKKAFFFKLHKKLPRFSFSLSIFVAIAGILFLLSFPLLLLILPFNLFDSVIQAKELKDWIDAAILLVFIVIGAVFTWSLYKLQFSLPTGLDVTKEKFPQLVELIEELKEEFGKPKIDRIIIKDQYELRVVKTPRSGMPFLNSTTLIIGLPVLLTMSPLYFKALMARRIGQLSTQHTPITTRL